MNSFLTGRMPIRTMALMAWAVAAAVFTLKSSSFLGVRSLDSDDAMRLVQVRDLLAGQGWFDLVQHRVAPPDGLVMHWSRIVDIGVAGLILAFATILPMDLAERAASAVWPTALLLPTLIAVASIGRSLGGRRAPPLALVLFLTIGPAGTQFFAGRIDHHNVQILACLVAVAAVLRMRDRPVAGLLGGFAGAVLLAVGIEALPSLALTCAGVGLLLVFDPQGCRRGALLFGAGLSAGSLAVTAAFVPGAQILSGHCDALSAPYLGAVVAGGAGLALFAAAVDRIDGRPWRLAAALAVGALALAVAVMLGPQCLRGPVAEIDPRIGPVWLGGVQEMEPLWTALLRGDMLAAGGLGHLLFGLSGMMIAWPLAAGRRRAALAFVVSLQVTAFVVALGQIRGIYYADAFAAPLAAAGLVALIGRVRVAPANRNAAALAGMLAIAGCGMVVKGAAVMAGVDGEHASVRLISPGEARAAAPAGGAIVPATSTGCGEPHSYDVLQGLPPTLILAGVDLGPFLLSGGGRHTVLGAPYHRNVSGILASHDLMSLPVAGAEPALRERGVGLVALCGGSQEAKVSGSLAEALLRGAAPAWLEAVPTDGPVRLYRLR